MENANLFLENGPENSKHIVDQAGPRSGFSKPPTPQPDPGAPDEPAPERPAGDETTRIQSESGSESESDDEDWYEELLSVLQQMVPKPPPHRLLSPSSSSCIRRRASRPALDCYHARSNTITHSPHSGIYSTPLYEPGPCRSDHLRLSLDPREPRHAHTHTYTQGHTHEWGLTAYGKWLLGPVFPY